MRPLLKSVLGASALASLFSSVFAPAAVSVLAYHYDQSNLGVNSYETSLTPSDLTVNTFQKLYSVPVDSKIFAEPLYVPGVTVTGGAHAGKHDLVIVGTQGDILYAIDAASGVIVWQTSFLVTGLPGATTITPVPDTDSLDYYNATPTIGILGTPVIDGTTNLLYVLVKTKQIITGQSAPSFVSSLYKINIANGNATANANIVSRNDFAVTIYDGTTYTYRTATDPTALQDPFVPGTGDGNVTVNNQKRVYFNSLRELHRMSLILSNGNVYACFASAVGINPYHGWMLGFDKNTLAITSSFNASPNAYWGGIWSSGGRPVVDSSNNIYIATGNGPFDGSISKNGVSGLNAQNFPVNGDYGDCLIKLAPDSTTSVSNQSVNGWGIKVVDYFTPSNTAALFSGDLDLGCGGILLLPDAVGSTAHPHLLVTAGKQGTIYLLDRDSLGKFVATDNSVQELPAPALAQCFDTPAFFNNTFYYAAENDNGKAFTIANGAIAPTPVKTPDIFGLRGSTPFISSNGSTHAIVWNIDSASGQLRAYSAGNYATELWTSDLAPNSRDALGTGVKFTVPTVADGRVFCGTATALVAYGLNPTTDVFTSDPPTATGTAGALYSFTFTAAGSPAPTFTLTSGALPPGLTLSSSGVLSGSPTTAGTYTGTVTASSSGLTPATQTFTITISPAESDTPTMPVIGLMVLAGLMFITVFAQASRLRMVGGA